MIAECRRIVATRLIGDSDCVDEPQRPFFDVPNLTLRSGTHPLISGYLCARRLRARSKSLSIIAVCYSPLFGSSAAGHDAAPMPYVPKMSDRSHALLIFD